MHKLLNCCRHAIAFADSPSRQFTRSSFIMPTLALAALLIGCGDKGTCAGCEGVRLDVTGTWDVIAEFGEAGTVTDQLTMTLNAVMTDSPQQGDFKFQLPSTSNPSASFTGNTINGKLKFQNTDFGSLTCSGGSDILNRSYQSTTCTITDSPVGLYLDTLSTRQFRETLCGKLKTRFSASHLQWTPHLVSHRARQTLNSLLSV